ncbi:MAG: hypothetical protein V4671_34090 [Armatimonadota bacterium]
MIPTDHYLDYAAGYLELGLLDEASEELELIEGEDRLSAEVMRLRCRLYSAAKNWELLLAVSKHLAILKPAEPAAWLLWGRALRKLERVEEAREVLLEAMELHPMCARLHFHLACCDSLLGYLHSARIRAAAASEMDPALKGSILSDPDLNAIWENMPTE